MTCTTDNSDSKSVNCFKNDENFNKRPVPALLGCHYHSFRLVVEMWKSSGSLSFLFSADQAIVIRGTMNAIEEEYALR